MSYGLTQTTHAALPVKITDVRVSHSSQKTRVVLEFNSRPVYKTFRLNNPARYVVDIAKGSWEAKLSPDIFVNSPIHHLRKSHSSHRLRIVFDLEHAVKINHLLLPDHPNHKYRLVIDFFGDSTDPANSSTVIPKPILTVAKKKNQQLRDIIIVIDPGHGGKDPGAIGRNKTREKDVVLGISKYLKQMIDKQPGMHAVLTRQGDYYVGLRQRLILARKDNADMFIAVHADAFKTSKARGSSIYALSDRGASSEAARWLAEKENYSELGEINLGDYQDNLLRSVLINLSQTATIGASLDLGSRILKQLDKIARLHYHKVEQAPFVVLKSPDIPSILVETGFISNSYEEKQLANPSYQKRLATAIMQGARNYFYSYPPQDSWLAQYHSGNNHKVSSGETLSGIALRYHVNIQELRRLNGLSSDLLKIDQTLKIPGRKS